MTPSKTKRTPTRLRYSDLLVTPKGLWFQGSRYPCTIGRGGIVEAKREGDGGTPVGVHLIMGVLYRPDRMRCPVPMASPIRPYHLWCDDPSHAKYNQMTRTPFDGSAERMARPDRLYDLVLVTDWNCAQPKSGGGSAIFIHRWRRPGIPTEGCIGLHPRHLLYITERLDPLSRLVVRPQP